MAAVALATCSSLGAPPNGSVVVTTSRGGVHVATYGCNPGFQMFGNLTRVCSVDGVRWSGSQPYCQGMEEWFLGSYSLAKPLPLPRTVSQVSCGNPPSVDNSDAWVAPDSSGIPIVTYSCNNDTSSKVFAHLRCQNGSWHGQLPACNSE